MLRIAWGKILGGFFGFAVAGPIGAILGIFLGNLFDKGMQYNASNYNASFRNQTQQVFFKATFLVMGHLSKADGRVSEQEIRVAKSVMQRMQLTSEEHREAIHYFTQGKSGDFRLDEVLAELYNTCRYQSSLLKMFVEIQCEAAMADGGHVGFQKQRILETIFQRLGVGPVFKYQQRIFEEVWNQYYSRQGGQGSRQYRQQYQQSSAPRSNGLTEAFATLEVSEQATQVEVKRAYRKLMSQHHPDKLIAKGLPENMIKIATEKSQKIQAAYEKIRQAKGF